MGTLRKNIAANYVGQGVAGVLGLVAVPIYLRYLGPQGYGLVAFFLSLQSVMLLFDMGMSASATRETARALELSADPNARRHLLRTLEVFYFGVAAVALAGMAAATEWVAANWIKDAGMDVAVIAKCGYLAAGCIALRFPVALYQGFFRGMEKQVDLNLLYVCLLLVKNLGGILIVVFVSPTVLAYYEWQLIFSICEVLALAYFSWRNLGGIRTGPARFQGALLRAVWKFAAKVGGISVVAVLMKQLDKLAVSRLLPIEFTGYYSTASMGGNAMVKVYAPVQSAVFPRFTRMLARGEDLRELFHANCQFVAFIAAPAAAALMVFPAEFLRAWTGSETLANAAGPALTLLALWTLSTALQSVPNMVQLAEGITWLPLYTNIVTIILLAPGLYFGIVKFGLLGAAMCWGAQGVLSYLVVPLVMFRYTLQGEAGRYYFADTLPFVMGALGCFVTVRFLFPPENVAQLIAVGAGAAWCYAVLCWACSRTLRTRLESIPFGGKALVWARRGVEKRLGRSV